MKIKHGFMEVTYSEDEAAECADNDCTRLITGGTTSFIDIQGGGKLYCEICGPCERYHRKKATEREITT